MSDNSKLPGDADFTHEVFHRLANQIRRHMCQDRMAFSGYSP